MAVLVIAYFGALIIVPEGKDMCSEQRGLRSSVLAMVALSTHFGQNITWPCRMKLLKYAC